MANGFTVSDDGLNVLYTNYEGDVSVHRRYTKIGPAARFAATGNAVMAGADIHPGYDPAPTHPVDMAAVAGYWDA